MNYSNMIEEKNLKKTFIVATLCSTLIGTFTASMSLYDRLAEKRKQGKKDVKQDDEIKKLREEISASEERSKEAMRDSHAPQQGRRDDVGDNLGMAGAMIQRQYDEGYGRMGRKFAMGDALTENQLQAHIIALQQTVINVLQDALYNDRPLTRTDQAKIIAASNAAREGSLNALREQQARLGVGIPPQRALPPPERAPTVVEIEAEPLFCHYALHLQYTPHKPLAASFAPGEDCHCPACGQLIAAASDDFWKIGKRTLIFISEGGYEKEVLETREFHLAQRFVIKCHTPDGEYACVICSKHRDVDAICRSVEALVNHVGNFHEVEELEREVDLRERAIPKSVLARPPPPVPSPPMTRDMRDARESVLQYR